MKLETGFLILAVWHKVVKPVLFVAVIAVPCAFAYKLMKNKSIKNVV